MQDPRFELADPGASQGSRTPFNGGQTIDGGYWNVTQGKVIVDTQNQWVYDGNKSVYLNAAYNASGNNIPGSLTQYLTTVVGQVYQISFWANADVSNTFSVTFGGVQVAGVPSSIAVNFFPNPYPPANPNSGLFTSYSGTAEALSTSTALTLTASSVATSTSLNMTVEIDNVSVTPGASAAVPEPSSLLLTTIVVMASVPIARRGRKLQGLP